MVAPTYYLAANIFRGASSFNTANVDCGYAKRITGIPEDEQGLNVSVLESQLENLEQEPEMEKPHWQRCTYRYVFYGVPTFSNPTGSIMSLSRRNRLIEVCLSVSILIVACKEIRHAADNGRRL